MTHYHTGLYGRLGLALVGLALVSLLLSCGNPVPKVYHVGILSGLDFFADTADGFKSKMTELGYVEGKNIIYDVQKTNFDPSAEERILKKFVSDKVDLILVFPTEASMEAKQITRGTTIPVLFTNAVVEGLGLIKSVREPGENVTGVRFPGPELALKRFEIMRELVPQAKRYLIPVQRGYPNVEPQMEKMRSVAEASGVTLTVLPVDNAAELESELQTRAKAADLGFDTIVAIPEPITVTPDSLGVLNKFAAEHKIPFGGAFGSAFGVVTNNVAVGKQAAPLADKILQGTPAGTIPVASADTFLQINYKIAQAQGLVIPDGLLKMANEVVR